MNVGSALGLTHRSLDCDEALHGVGKTLGENYYGHCALGFARPSPNSQGSREFAFRGGAFCFAFSFVAILCALALARIALAASATSPPAEAPPVAINATLVMHTGYIGFLILPSANQRKAP